MAETGEASLRPNIADGFDVDPSALKKSDRYKLLCGLIVPRPIALVTTLTGTGVVNAAPFSFFNVFSEEPPLIVLGVNARSDGSVKDTTRNISDRKEFVVHLVTEDIAEAMNVCAIDFPHEMSEVQMAGMTLVPSRTVAPPAIAEAPVALECRLSQLIPISPVRNLVLGEIVRIRAREGVIEPERLHVDTRAYRPIGRLAGNQYAKQGDVFELRRGTYVEWLKERGEEPA